MLLKMEMRLLNIHWGTFLLLLFLSFFNLVLPIRCYYEEGIGVYPDYSQALVWFSKSAAKGYKLAEDKLNIPFNKRKSVVISTKRKRSKRYYEESIRIAEQSRKAKVENDCHVM